MPPIYYIKNGNLSFADKVVLSELEIYLYAGDKICLVGRNGCGKSSLMKVIYGEYELDSGELFQDTTLKVGYLKQDVRTNTNSSIYDFILKDNGEKIDKYRADIILSKLEIDGNINLKDCSGGQIRRAHLAKALILEPDILLLDEPTNHLDIAAIEWLEEFVKSYNGTIICISHDRAFLNNVTNKTWWLDRGILRKSDQGFRYFDQWQELILQQEEAQLRKLSKKLDTEKAWLNTGVTARRKRNQKRLAQLKRLRESLKSQTTRLGQAKLRLSPEELEEARKTRFILEVDNISFAYANRKIIDNFSFRVKKGEKIAIIGPNGSGKSTFIKLLIKELQTQTGRIRHGTNLEITYFDQHRINLNPSHTLQQTLIPSGGDQVFLSNNRTMHIAAYLKKFMFDPRLLSAKVSTLSGGEASRLLLAKALINPGNLLILDEPTNDLDMDSLEILLDILTEYSGTLLIVSHDRDFLDRLVTRSLIFTDNGIIDLIGGYEDYRQFIEHKSLPSKNRIIKTPRPAESRKALDQNTKKLSYKYQRLLETLPIEIEELEKYIKNLEVQLSDSNLYPSDREKFNKLSKELQDSRKKLDELMQQWLDID